MTSDNFGLTLASSSMVCSTEAPTGCSFVRERLLAPGQTFVETLRERYMTHTTETQAFLRGEGDKEVPLELVGFQDLETKIRCDTPPQLPWCHATSPLVVHFTCLATRKADLHSASRP